MANTEKQHSKKSTAPSRLVVLGVVFATTFLQVPAYGGEIQYRYDAQHRPIWKKNPNGIVEEFEYDAAGDMVRIRSTNGTLTIKEYDDQHHLAKQETWYRGKALSARNYPPHASASPKNASRQAALSFANRATRTPRATAASTGSNAPTDEYDANDRLIKETAPAGVTIHTWGAAGREMAVSGPGREETYTYDTEDHMLSATINGRTSTYEYDWQGNKVASITDGVRTDYLIDPSSGPYPQVIEERQNGVLAKTYNYNPATGEPLSVTDSSGTHTMLTDGQGSVRVMTESAGRVEGTQGFDAFGVKTASAGAAIPRGYTGEETSPDGRLVYLRQRWMEPQTGRFISRDPWGGFPDDPSTLHPYVYAQGNPVNRRDPSGLFGIAETLTSAAIMGTLGNRPLPQISAGAPSPGGARPVMIQAYSTGNSHIPFSSLGGGTSLSGTGSGTECDLGLTSSSGQPYGYCGDRFEVNVNWRGSQAARPTVLQFSSGFFRQFDKMSRTDMVTPFSGLDIIEASSIKWDWPNYYHIDAPGFSLLSPALPFGPPAYMEGSFEIRAGVPGQRTLDLPFWLLVKVPSFDINEVEIQDNLPQTIWGSSGGLP